MIIATVVLMYSAIKFEQLITKYNPNINDYYVDAAIDNVVNLNDKNFRIAFMVEDYYAPHQIKDSEEYVKWVFRVFGYKDNISYERLIPYHRCNEKDYDEFYQIEKTMEIELSAIKSDSNRGFFCFDWEEDNPFEIYGTDQDAEYQRLEM